MSDPSSKFRAITRRRNADFTTGRRFGQDQAARPRSEWPEYGGVSAASTFGWKEWEEIGVQRSWWQTDSVDAFKQRIAGMGISELRALRVELAAAVSTIQVQMQARGRSNHDWFTKARAAHAYIVEKRNHLNVHLAAVDVNTDSKSKAAARASSVIRLSRHEERMARRLVLLTDAETKLDAGDITGTLRQMLVVLKQMHHKEE